MNAETVSKQFSARFNRPPKVLVRAPGRLNLLGAHVDYHQGWVLPTAIDRQVWLAASPARGTQSRFVAADLSQEACLDLRHLPPPVAERNPAKAHWQDYPGGVAHSLDQAGYHPVPIDALFTRNVPIGAGVSSSAAVEMAFLLAWEELSGFRLDNMARARLGQVTENHYLGVGSGLMDQFASLHGQAGHLLLLDCRHLTWDPIPLPRGLAFLVTDSGIRRRLADSAFNDRKAECQEALCRLRRAIPGLQTLRDLSPAALEEHAQLLSPRLHRRVRHVVEECARVQTGAEALRRGDLGTFAQAVRDSHASSRDLYEVSLAELDLLAESAWEHPACHGARLMGGGFGGCVGALVQAGEEDAVAQAQSQAFRRRFGNEPTSFCCRSADGACLI